MNFLAKVLGVALLGSSTIMMIYTFYTAYFNGGKIIVFVNRYGEGTIEAIIIALLIPFAIYVLYSVMKEDK